MRDRHAQIQNTKRTLTPNLNVGFSTAGDEKHCNGAEGINSSSDRYGETTTDEPVLRISRCTVLGRRSPRTASSTQLTFSVVSLA
jgi:hypothetical protein